MNTRVLPILGAIISQAVLGQTVPQSSITPATTGTIAVSSTVSGTIPVRFIGLSYPKAWLISDPYLLNSGDSRMTSMFTNIGCGVLRLIANETLTYTPLGAGHTAGQISDSDINSFAGFISSLGCWQVIYPLGYTNNAQDAAEAAYVSAALGANLAGFAIGNEPDGTTEGNPTAAAYAASWNTIANAVKMAVPSAVITGPDLSTSINMTTWDNALLSYVPASGLSNAKLVSMLSQHYYIAAGASLTTTQMLSPYGSGSGWQVIASDLAGVEATYPVPFRMTEMNNAYNGGAANVSNSFASALYALDVAFNIAQTLKAVGVNFSTGGSGTNGNVPYSPIDDTCTSTTIPCASATVYGWRPEYSGLLMFNLATQNKPATMLTTALSVGSVNATAYTLQSTPGQYRTVVINKDESNNLALTVTFPGSVTSAVGYLLNDPSGLTDNNSSNILIQGTNPNFNTGDYTLGVPYGLPVSPSGAVTVYLPFGSAILITTSSN